MRSTLLLLLLPLSITACSKKKDDPPANTANKPSDTKPTETKPTETKPGEVVAPPGQAKRIFTLLGCDKLPKSLKDKYFAGKTLEDETNDANSGGCGVKDSIVGFEVACLAAGTPAGVYDSFAKRLKEVKADEDTKQLDIGKVAVRWHVGNLSAPNLKVQVFDNDSECWIIGTLEPGGDAEGFAKDAIAAFPMK